jgi:hypothetical protein
MKTTRLGVKQKQRAFNQNKGPMNTQLQYKSNAEMQMVVKRMPSVITEHYKEYLLSHFTKFAGQPTMQVEFEAEFGRFEDQYYAGLPPFMRTMPGSPNILTVLGLVDVKPK